MRIHPIFSKLFALQNFILIQIDMPLPHLLLPYWQKKELLALLKQFSPK